MSESQSRYSIVERLTSRKLDIMSAKAELDDGLRNKQTNLNSLEQDYKDWLGDIEENIKRDKRSKEKKILNAKNIVKNTKERIIEKQKVYDEKIKALELALKSIQQISKSQST